MGVFARLLGRSKVTPEASDAAAPAGPEPAGAEAEQADRTESAETGEAGSAEATEAVGDGHEDVAVRSDAGTDDTSESTGIPRQQSAGEAADSEAGEGALR
ncbi:hypothetical protein JK361_29625 [Streptomyces sp. 5-8]|uniref:Gliding motility protein n=1 Tax=Streptomyces musisoli TaxID=2802280 RepID=A0ABS1P9G2_9ACTN|nr:MULTISPECIES: hypothetical protein [Streptomyces]MBL1108697.1 hypothetical protein [Streptomyces musisoli]MBY8842467.1 hypothetical protein [Streptomyces sp. SP2-10]